MLLDLNLALEQVRDVWKGLTPQEVEEYTKRFSVANAVKWEDGRSYSIGEKGAVSEDYPPVFHCICADGEVFLGAEGEDGDCPAGDYRPLLQVVTTRSIIKEAPRG